MRWMLPFACLLSAPALAQTAPPPAAAPAPAPISTPALRERADELLAILDGRGDYDAFFDARFREAVPRARFDPIREQLKTALGKPLRVASLTATGAWSADLSIGYERGTAAMRIVVDPAAPHRVTGLLVTGTGPLAGDSIAKLSADFAALPGRSGFGIYALEGGSPRAVAERNGGERAPLGSAFKLWVLAEAARQVAAGERRWGDVVPIGQRSIASGTLHAWPVGAPVTLHTLAAMMISTSDNSATDTLMTALGRAEIDAVVARVGVATPAATLPVVTTRELIAVKADPAMAAAWGRATTPAARTRLLAANAAAITASPLDPSVFAGKPASIDTVEWFASPLDMARTLDWLRVSGDDTARAIMAINPGTDPATAARFAYVGYKGGSEPGVMTLNYLVRDKGGRWFAVTGNWHRSDIDVEALRFTGLMNRALALAAGR